MRDDIFSDGVAEIALVGGVVRLDLVAMSAVERGDNNQPKMEFRGRVVMPPEAFLQTFGAMERVVDQLIDRGLVTRRTGNGAEAETPPPAKDDEGASTSPNF